MNHAMRLLATGTMLIATLPAALAHVNYPTQPRPAAGSILSRAWLQENLLNARDNSFSWTIGRARAPP